MADLAELLKRFERRGVALVSISDSLDTKTAAGRLVLNLLVSVSQWEREAIGERTREALRHKRSLGERVGTVPYGYRVDEDGRLSPDEAEQGVLAQMARLQAAGLATREMAMSPRSSRRFALVRPDVSNSSKPSPRRNSPNRSSTGSPSERSCAAGYATGATCSDVPRPRASKPYGR